MEDRIQIHIAFHMVHCAPRDYPSGKAGSVLTVEFTVLGISHPD
jgi:predicted 3-demethylubiquinone-9 3-methyltransferase (glyoxalase superfamily)